MNTSLKSLFSIRDGQVHIYGQPIGRHETYPWLYCANDIHKALVKRAVRMAERTGKDAEKAKAKITEMRPGNWIKRKVQDTPDTWVKEINAAGKLSLQAYFNTKSGVEIKKKIVALKVTNGVPFNAAADAALKMRDVAIQTKPGRYGGTYLCEQLILAYCEWTSPKFAAHVRQLFLDFAHGKQELHEQLDKNHIRAKGTSTRQESKERWADWKQWNSDHKASYIVTTGVVTHEVLGKSKSKYMEETGIGEPFRDNISEATLALINSAQMLTISLGTRDNADGQHAVNSAAMRAGRAIRSIANSSNAEIDKLIIDLEAQRTSISYD
jgi:hypothetical protein